MLSGAVVMKRLSILVPTIESRSDKLARLLSILHPQLTDAVEVLTELDDGQKSTGLKRNALLERASGEYVCFVDDDDIVSSDYVKRILQATASKPDCVGIHLLHFRNDALIGFSFHSVRYTCWHEESDLATGYIRAYRCPNHLNPVRREYALKCRFPDSSFAEDRVYSLKIREYLRSEEFILEPIYCYLSTDKR
jgi:glycosyltransferase involved in cell wall biosynthesis